MDELIREVLHAKASEVSVPSGAWERQQATLETRPRGGGQGARRWWPTQALLELTAVAVVVLLLAVALIGGVATRRYDGAGDSALTSDNAGPNADPPRPAGAGTTDAAGASDPSVAFHGLGKLALIRDGRLYILDGGTDTLREVEGAAPATAPVWSGDGRWLAFWLDNGTGGRLMLADAATGQAREMTGLPGPITGYTWSPVGSALAVGVAVDSQPGTPPVDRPPQGPGEIWLVDAPAYPQARFLAAVDTQVGPMAWSPDGSRIAYVTTLQHPEQQDRRTVLEWIPASGGNPARWYVSEEQSGVEVVEWWPDGGGILFTVRRPWNCNSCAADGLPLKSLALESREPVSLPTVVHVDRWLSWSPGGRELLMVRGGGRPVWDGKALTVCDASTGGCRDLPQPDDAVSLDPAWSPDGNQVAFVRAQRRPGEWGFSSDAQLREWVSTRTLWVAAPDGSGAREVVAAGRGIHRPAWARDGRHLLYIRQGALWVIDLEQPGENLVANLGEEEDLFGFYGHVGRWDRAVAWYRGH